MKGKVKNPLDGKVDVMAGILVVILDQRLETI